MKLFVAVFAMTMVLSADGAKAAEPKPSKSGKLTVPKGAVETEPGTFHYTDAQGKKWIYRTTPFGVARLQDQPEAKQAPAPDPTAGIKATADGDTIHFERPGPFGVYKWQKNKSDLDETERAVWNRTLAVDPAK
jgi:hypothetical protein